MRLSHGFFKGQTKQEMTPVLCIQLPFRKSITRNITSDVALRFLPLRIWSWGFCTRKAFYAFQHVYLQLLSRWAIITSIMRRTRIVRTTTTMTDSLSTTASFSSLIALLECQSIPLHPLSTRPARKPDRTLRTMKSGEISWLLPGPKGPPKERVFGEAWRVVKSYHYCWWKKSCTTWDVQIPVNNGINYLSCPVSSQNRTKKHYHPLGEGSWNRNSEHLNVWLVFEPSLFIDQQALLLKLLE